MKGGGNCSKMCMYHSHYLMKKRIFSLNKIVIILTMYKKKDRNKRNKSIRTVKQTKYEELTSEVVFWLNLIWYYFQFFEPFIFDLKTNINNFSEKNKDIFQFLPLPIFC